MQKREKTQKRTGQVRTDREFTAQYTVPRSDTLLEFLLKKCNTSRNNVKSLLTRGQVLVNGSVVTRHDFALAKDDEVKLSKKPQRNALKERVTPTRTVRLPFPILLENDDFIAVEKPCGLLSVEMFFADMSASRSKSAGDTPARSENNGSFTSFASFCTASTASFAPSSSVSKTKPIALATRAYFSLP
jgi:ribosome-associated protein YbcJ (S4-like RNA binding protein)